MTFKEKLYKLLYDDNTPEQVGEFNQVEEILALIESDIVGKNEDPDEFFEKHIKHNIEVDVQRTMVALHERNLLRQKQREKLK